ncbi:hypothetical protein DOY81_002416 [Sarcophaga bullata]|nr:hypothetical protein DOY81_002416 [Sarcophaga bullata]
MYHLKFVEENKEGNLNTKLSLSPHKQNYTNLSKFKKKIEYNKYLIINIQ